MHTALAVATKSHACVHTHQPMYINTFTPGKTGGLSTHSMKTLPAYMVAPTSPYSCTYLHRIHTSLAHRSKTKNKRESKAKKEEQALQKKSKVSGKEDHGKQSSTPSPTKRNPERRRGDKSKHTTGGTATASNSYTENRNSRTKSA